MFRDELMRRYQGSGSAVTREIVALKKYAYELRLRGDLDAKAFTEWLRNNGGEIGEDWSYFLNGNGLDPYTEAYLWCNDASVASYAKLAWGSNGS